MMKYGELGTKWNQIVLGCFGVWGCTCAHNQAHSKSVFSASKAAPPQSRRRFSKPSAICRALAGKCW